MKRIIYSVLIILAGLQVACKKEVIHVANDDNNQPVQVNLDFEFPSLQVATRSFDESNDLVKYVYAFVFDGNGFFVEKTLAEAGNITSLSLESGMKIHLQAKLTFNQSKRFRRVHFLATREPIDNIDEIVKLINEKDIFAAIECNMDETSHDITPYFWQMQNLPEGINENTFKTSKIQLVRNYSRITLKVNSEVYNFTLKKWTIINQPKKAKVLPFNIVDGTLINDYQNKSYEDLKELGYMGYTPNLQSSSLYIPKEDDMLDFSSTLTNFAYLYERVFVDNPKMATSVVIKAAYQGSDYFYRIDLIKDKDISAPDYIPGRVEYYNILRNFSYDIVINKVTGKGYKTYKEACEEVAQNNIFGSIKLRDLCSVANDNERLDLKYSRVLLTNNNNIVLKFRYQEKNYDSFYWPLNSTKLKEKINILTEKGLTDLIFPIENGASFGEPANYSISDSPDAQGWYTLTIKNVVAPTYQVKQQSLWIITKTGVPREIRFTLRKPYIINNFTCNPYIVALGAQKEVRLKWSVPSELNKYVFPLEFVIRSDEHSIYPMDQNYVLPVYLIENQTDPANNDFGYKLTITHEKYLEYYSNPTHEDTPFPINLRFLTNKKESATDIYLNSLTDIFEVQNNKVTLLNYNW